MRLAKRPLLPLVRFLEELGFDREEDDLFARKTTSAAVELLRLAPGFRGAHSKSTFSLLPIAGVYYKQLDCFSHVLRGTPYPRPHPYEHIGCTVDLLARTIPRGGMEFSISGTNEESMVVLTDALRQLVFPALAKLCDVDNLIELLGKNSVEPWSAIRRDLLPLAYLVVGEKAKAIEISQAFLRQLESEESQDSPLRRSYSSFASAIESQ